MTIKRHYPYGSTRPDGVTVNLIRGENWVYDIDEDEWKRDHGDEEE